MTFEDAPFRVRISVRGYELDSQGHVNHAVYLQYAEHARWEAVRAAGLPQGVLHDAGVGPVVLEITARYLRELTVGDEVDVTFGFVPGGGKTIRFEQDLLLTDGTPVATITGLAGLLGLADRKLVLEPEQRLRALATSPEVLGL